MDQKKVSQAINELLYDIQTRDVIKAKLVLKHLEEYEKKVWKRLLFELNRADDDFVIQVLASLAGEYPGVYQKFPLLEQILEAKVLDNQSLIIDKLRPEKPGLASYIKLVGKLKLKKAVNPLESLLPRTKDPEIIILLLEALGALAANSSVRIVAEFLYLDNTRISEASARALARIGSKEAMACLFDSLGKSRYFDELILDLFTESQDNISLEKLNQALGSENAHVRNYAADKLAEIGSKAVPFLVENLWFFDADLQIQSLNILARIKEQSSIKPIRKFINTHPEDVNVRFAAYESLAELPLPQGAYMLVSGLTDPEESIRLAAARAIDNNINNSLIAGIKNLFKDKDEQAQDITLSILNAKAKGLFIALLDCQEFRDLAFSYLQSSIPSDIRDFYLQILHKENDTKALTYLKYASFGRYDTNNRHYICVVDDSQMILMVYRNKFFDLGYKPVLFSRAKEALKWLEGNLPKAIFTDLNMPEMDGIEFIMHIRGKYSYQELPVIMVSSQSDVQEQGRAYQAGANDMLMKPFEDNDLRQALERQGIFPDQDKSSMDLGVSI